MEKRIELEKRGRAANQISELNLDNCRSTNICGLTDEFTLLKTLSLINVGLTSLKGFPKLPSLKKLELSDNRISGGLDYLQGCTNLTHINLSGNKFKDLESLEPLKTFESLHYLDLFNNPITTTENYREQLFKMVPSLKYLDGFDIDDVEAASEDDGAMNGCDSDDESDSDDLDDDEAGDEEEQEIQGEEEYDNPDDAQLADLYKSNLDEESEGDDWEGDVGEEEEDDDEDSEPSSADEDELRKESPSGKRKMAEEPSNGVVQPQGEKSTEASEERGTKRKLEEEDA